MIMKKTFVCALATTFVLSANFAEAAVHRYTGEDTFYYGEDITAAMAKERARSRAYRNALEQAGVYVRSYVKVKNLTFEDDEIETITAGLLKAVGQPQYTPSIDGGGYTMKAVMVAEIDDSQIGDWTDRNQQEKTTLVEQNKKLKEANAAQEKQIADLQKQLAAAKTEQEKDKLRVEVTAADNAFLATQKIDNAWQFYFSGDYTTAITVFDESIKLDGSNAEAWHGRGTAYGALGNYQKAITDFTKAIALNPKNDASYCLRGAAHSALGNFQNAIADFTKAIALNPKDDDSYCVRGTVYGILGDYQKAIADCTQAISINSKNYDAYYNRGVAYGILGDYQKAIADFTKTIAINPKYALAYNNRGQAYLQLGDTARANADLAKAKELGL